MSPLPEGERRRLLALIGITLYERRLSPPSRRSCVVVRLDRAKEDLTPEQRRVLSRLLKALAWEGAFRAEVPEDERVVLELALGVPASGRAERTVRGEPIDRLAESEGARRALWQRIAPHLPLPGAGS